MNKKLTNHRKIKKYVIDTILTGDKKRIIKVMNRYKEWLMENDIYEQAKKIFK